MYNKDFLCTYKLHSEEQQTILYQIQLLQAFNIKEWNDDIVNNNIKILFNDFKHIEQIKKCLQFLKTHDDIQKISMLMEDNDIDDEMVFKLLFQFDYFNMTHKCICDPCKKNLDCLLSSIKNSMKNNNS